MMQKIILKLFSAFLIISQPVFAAESDYDTQVRKRASLPQKWFHCKSNSDCVLASVPCMASLAIAASHKISAEPIICKAYNNCTGGCDGSMEDTSIAICDKGQCVTILGAKKEILKTPDVQFKLKDLHAVPASN